MKVAKNCYLKQQKESTAKYDKKLSQRETVIPWYYKTLLQKLETIKRRLLKLSSHDISNFIWIFYINNYRFLQFLCIFFQINLIEWDFLF